MSSFLARKRELEQQISDLETTLHALNKELHEQVKAEQHDAIDHLEDYLEEVDHKYASLRELLVMVLNETRALFQGESNKDRGH